MTEERKAELYNLCYSCLIDGSSDDEPMTAEDAEYTLNAWREEGDEELCEIIEGVSGAELAEIYNDVLEQMQ